MKTVNIANFSEREMTPLCKRLIKLLLLERGVINPHDSVFVVPIDCMATSPDEIVQVVDRAVNDALCYSPFGIILPDNNTPMGTVLAAGVATGMAFVYNDIARPPMIFVPNGLHDVTLISW